MTKALICGDTHGNFYHLRDLVDVARANEVETIFQPGDFGFWEHTPEGVDFLDGLQDYLYEHGVKLIFIDGNHDNHPLLWSTYGNTVHTIVRPYIWYEPRGQTFTFGDSVIQTVGGAFSIDARWRRQEMKKGAPASWWAEEELTTDQVNEAVVAATVNPPDVMITHDAPHGCPMGELATITLPPVLAARSKDNRMRVREIAEAAQPDHLYHGHFHVRLDYDLRLSSGKIVECHSLGADTDMLSRKLVRSQDSMLTKKGERIFENSYMIVDF